MNNIDINQYFIDLDEEIEEIEPIYSIEGVPVFSKGNISTIIGRQKAGKGFLNSLFISEILKDNENATVLICDTEQAKSHVIKAAKRIPRLLECETSDIKDRLKILKLRELPFGERMNVIEAAILEINPTFCVIDGARDLLGDINNSKESSELVGRLMKLSTDCNNHICVVLHMNKTDFNARGHLGTELLNKSETVISIMKDKRTKIMKVSPVDCRNIDFKEFFFKINNLGLPELCEPPIKPKNTDEIELLFDGLLPENVFLTYVDLHKKIMETCNIKKTAAENKIKAATEQGLISKNAGRYYRAAEQEEQENFDFTDELPD